MVRSYVLRVRSHTSPIGDLDQARRTIVDLDCARARPLSEMQRSVTEKTRNYLHQRGNIDSNTGNRKEEGDQKELPEGGAKSIECADGLTPVTVHRSSLSAFL